MKILFLTPTGGRTGSEMMLWYLMKHIGDRGFETASYVRQKSELFSKNSLTSYHFQYRFRRSFLLQIFETLVHKLTKRTPEQWYLWYINKRFKPDYWYLNTISLVEFADLAQRLNVPYIVHAHEMISVFDGIEAVGFERMLQKANTVIACSEAVAKQYSEMGLSNIRLLHECIDTKKVVIKNTQQSIRRKLGLPNNAFVWLMSGSACMRKGIDFVPDLLQQLPQNAYLVWLGSASEYSAYFYTKKRTKNENLNFIMLGSKGQNDYYDYLNLCDGFVLLSREDPFPLVMIEAAFLQKPIVGFESGGIAEFVQEGMGKVVAAFDIPKMAETMQQIMNGELTTDKNKLKQRAEMFDVEIQVENWQKIIESLA